MINLFLYLSTFLFFCNAPQVQAATQAKSIDSSWQVVSDIKLQDVLGCRKPYVAEYGSFFDDFKLYWFDCNQFDIKGLSLEEIKNKYIQDYERARSHEASILYVNTKSFLPMRLWNYIKNDKITTIAELIEKEICFVCEQFKQRLNKELINFSLIEREVRFVVNTYKYFIPLRSNANNSGKKSLAISDSSDGLSPEIRDLIQGGSSSEQIPSPVLSVKSDKAPVPYIYPQVPPIKQGVAPTIKYVTYGS